MKITKALLHALWFFMLTFYCAARLTLSKKRGNELHYMAWARRVAKLTNMKVSFEGEISKKGRFFVFNHMSYIDIPLLWNCLDGVFVAKKEVRSWPIIGYTALKAGTIFIDRASKGDVKRVNDLIDETLSKGKNIFVFAEGTSSDGKAILPYKSSLLNVAAKRGDAVRYGVLGYKTPEGEVEASDSISWWKQEDGFFSHLIGLLSLPGFEAKVCLAEGDVKNKDRKKLTKELWEKSVDLHAKKFGR